MDLAIPLALGIGSVGFIGGIVLSVFDKCLRSFVGVTGVGFAACLAPLAYVSLPLILGRPIDGTIGGWVLTLNLFMAAPLTISALLGYATGYWIWRKGLRDMTRNEAGMTAVGGQAKVAQGDNT